MTCLRLLVPDTWPHSTAPALPWALLGDDGRLLQQGDGAPTTWPAAHRTEAVLAGAQCTWHSASLPRAARREQAAALRYALEDSLLQEPDSQHLSPSERGAEQWAVLVIARTRLTELIAAFDQLGRPLDGAWSALQALPTSTDGWTVGLAAGGAHVRSGAHAGFSADWQPGEVPPLLSALSHPAAHAPATLTLYGAAPAEAAHWQQILGRPVQSAGTWTWYQRPPQATGLLHGEFAPRRRAELLQRLRPPLAVAASALTLWLLLALLDLGWQRQRLAALETEMRALLQTAQPGAPVLEPALQLQRTLDDTRRTHGQLASDDPLTLLADLADGLGPEGRDALHAVRGAPNGLELQFLRPPAAGLDARLQVRGLVLRPREVSASTARSASRFLLQRDLPRTQP